MDRCGFKNGYQKDLCLMEIGLCSKYDDHFKFNNRHNWAPINNYLMSTRIFTLIKDNIFIEPPKIMRKATRTALVWMCQSSYSSCMFHVPR